MKLRNRTLAGHKVAVGSELILIDADGVAEIANLEACEILIAEGWERLEAAAAPKESEAAVVEDEAIAKDEVVAVKDESPKRKKFQRER